MKHHHHHRSHHGPHHGHGRHFAGLPGQGCRHHHPLGAERPHRHRRGGRHGRLFDYGELRLLMLAMIAEKPRHGYELIKAIEERFAGSYAPSPGVIYPTLAWLDDMGYAAIEEQQSGRKLYRITPEGEAFLAANRQSADELLARTHAEGAEGVPDAVLRGMENLKTAMRLRLRKGGLDPVAASRIAAALDAAAIEVEQA